jgi:hypothetical protein
MNLPFLHNLYPQDQNIKQSGDEKQINFHERNEKRSPSMRQECKGIPL